jgi:hypothetical protein
MSWNDVKKIKVYTYFSTTSGLPKMLLTKITCQTNTNYKALTYIHRHIFYMSGRYFTLEELK